MKILIVSDIHGDYISFNKIINNVTFDKLIVLGDLNPYDYNYKNIDNDRIALLLKKYINKLILIKGNCDNYEYYRSMNIPIFNTITIPLNNHLVTLTHGDTYSRGFLPENYGDIFISGHTHVPSLIKDNDIIFANPGSVGKPRANSKKGYLLFEDNELILKDIDNNAIKKLIIN